MNMRTELTYEIYEKHKAGIPIEQLAEEYGISLIAVIRRIENAEHDEKTRQHMSEFQKRFPINIARKLMRNEIESEEDLYEAINSQRRIICGIGKKTAEEIGDVLGIKLTVIKTLDNHNALAFYKEPKGKTIRGNFCGTVDGSPISGVIEGEFLPL